MRSSSCCVFVLLASLLVGRPALASLEDALAIDGFFERKIAVAQALRAMQASDVEDAIDAIRSSHPTARGDEVLPLLRLRHGELSGASAVLKAEQEERRTGIERTIRGWARADPAGAWEWTLHREEPARPPSFNPWSNPGAWSRASIVRLAEILVDEGHEDFVVQKFLTSEDPNLQARLARLAAGLLLREGIEAVVSAAGILPPGAARVTLFATAASSKARLDPQAAFAWARNLPEPDERDAALGRVVSSWDSSGQNTEEVAIFLLAQPPGRDLDVTLRRFAERRNLALSLGAGLVERIVDPTQRNPGYQQLAQRILPPQPHMAATWGILIEDPEMRLGILRRAIDRWRITDPDAARTFVETHQRLTDSEREHLRPLLGGANR